MRRNYLGRVAATMAQTAGGRQDFLAMVSRHGISPEESAEGMASLMRVWGGMEPAEALAGMGDLPVGDRARDHARRVTTEAWMQRDPAAVIGWMSVGENAQPVGNQVDIYRKWAERVPEDASARFEELSRLSPDFREGVMKSLLTSYYQGGWIPFGRTAQSDGRIFSRLKIHYDQWTASAPGEASAWMGTLDPALQERLITPVPHETR